MYGLQKGSGGGIHCIEKVLVVKINLAWKGGKAKCPRLWELLFGLKMEIKTRNSLSSLNKRGPPFVKDFILWRRKTKFKLNPIKEKKASLFSFSSGEKKETNLGAIITKILKKGLLSSLPTTTTITIAKRYSVIPTNDSKEKPKRKVQMHKIFKAITRATCLYLLMQRFKLNKHKKHKNEQALLLLLSYQFL